MMHIAMIPAGRGAQDAAIYRYMHWFVRFHRREIDRYTLKALLNRVFYGVELPASDAVPGETPTAAR